MICVAGTLIGVLSAQPSHHDTQWFWASGKLLVHGQNPYDREAIGRMESAMGLPVKGIIPITLNPPYTLYLLTPLGFLHARVAVIAWSLLLALCFIVAVQAVRSMVDHPYEQGYILLAWCFAPALCCIEMGQTGLILLLGLALFLRLEQANPFGAGVALSLCAVKPHLFLPFGVVLLMWIAVRRRWTILLGAIAALILESLIATAFDHGVWSQYRSMARTERFVYEYIPTIGTALRYLIDRSALWIEFVPAALGSAWGVWYFWRNRENWEWTKHGSLLMLVSLLVAPYAWFTDQVLALPAILFTLLSVRGPRRGSVTLLMAIMIAAAVDMMASPSLIFKPDMILGLVWLGWYLYATSGAVRTKEAVVAG